MTCMCFDPARSGLQLQEDGGVVMLSSPRWLFAGEESCNGDDPFIVVIGRRGYRGECS